MLSYIVGGLIGFGTALACLLPPIIHFISGPLGPLIGGFTGSYTRKNTPSKGGVVSIGLVIGLGLGLLFLLAGLFLLSSTLISSIEQLTGLALPHNLPTGTLIKTGLILLVYGSLLGSLGAFLGVKVKERG